MSEPQTPLTSTPAASIPVSSPTLESLAATIESLRTAFHIALVLVAILAVSLFVFFLKETSLARRQITVLANAVSESEKTFYPQMEDFRTKLQVFTKTHPDFTPIYTRYFGPTNLGPSAPPPGRAQPLTNASGARLPPPAGR